MTDNDSLKKPSELSRKLLASKLAANTQWRVQTEGRLRTIVEALDRLYVDRHRAPRATHAHLIEITCDKVNSLLTDLSVELSIKLEECER